MSNTCVLLILPSGAGVSFATCAVHIPLSYSDFDGNLRSSGLFLDWSLTPLRLVHNRPPRHPRHSPTFPIIQASFAVLPATYCTVPIFRISSDLVLVTFSSTHYSCYMPPLVSYRSHPPLVLLPFLATPPSLSSPPVLHCY
ncbi:hypothetical protein FB451DRAFT_1282899 [Mycena latifolia]|nr:hypothetical protein FB451DRAFT_1282899 [Mycena latifolia]